MELWDLYDINRKPLQKTHNREVDMVSGEYHVVVQIWTVNNRREILLTLRHPDKDYPNCWESTAGSILTGETSLQGAVRELFEETGIHCTEDELHLLGTLREQTAFVDTYCLRNDITLTELTMQEGETVDAQWVSIDQLDVLFEAGEIAAPIKKRLAVLRTPFEEFLFNGSSPVR